MQADYPILFGAHGVPSWQPLDVPVRPSDVIDLAAVRARMKELGITQAELAKELGIQHQSAISNLLAGGRAVKAHEAASIHRFLKMTGPSQIDVVPVIGLTSAGNWREAIHLPGRRVPVPPGLAGANAFALEYRGDSMDEVLIEGAYIVVDPDQTHLYNDKVYLIGNGDHETQVKLYRSNPARFEPRSSNDQHKPIIMGETNVRVIGRVVWQGLPL